MLQQSNTTDQLIIGDNTSSQWPYSTPYSTPYPTLLSTDVYVTPVPIIHIGEIWNIYKPVIAKSCYWSNKEGDGLTAEQLHNPKTTPHITYQIECKTGTVTVIRSHKDRLILKVEMSSAHFMVPVPKKVAKRFLKVMNRYDEDPEILPLDTNKWWANTITTTNTPCWTSTTIPNATYGSSTSNKYSINAVWGGSI